jgi:ATP-binding cassette, subfamily F, member 3
MITLRDLTLRRGTRAILQGAEVTIHAGEKVGLVGRNGIGKSSLFMLLAGRLQPDQGDAEVPPRWRIGEVAQSMPETTDSATEFVLQGDLPLQAAIASLAAAEVSGDGHAMAEAHLALDEAGAFDARARAQALLLGLGFRTEQLDSPVNSFSGGWRMRLQLARALMCPADLLLLDEPTNHLDLDALVWLESWLQRWSGTMIVISHDREFLDAITRVTLHVEDARLNRYTGNYTAFEEARAERMAQAQAAYSRQQEKVADLTRFIERFRAKASKAKQAQSRVKALARMERLAPVLTANDFSFEFREPASLPNPMLSLRGVSVGYRASDHLGGGDKVIVRGIDRSVMAGERIGILGANGQGKSTLVKTISRALPALGGELVEGKGLSIGYFAQQEMDLLHADDTPLQQMIRLARTVGSGGHESREQALRDFLGQFRFTGEMVHQPVGTLSGGERARLVLAVIVWQRPNLLLLDEPTNHLDLDTREALSMALNGFEGTVMLVSHDRALLREVCDEFWLVADGGVDPFDGDLDDYQRWLLDVSRAQARGHAAPPKPSAQAAQAPSAPAAPNPTRAQRSPDPAKAAAAPRRDDRKAAAQARADIAARTRPLRVEMQGIDARLEKLGTERKELEAAFAAASIPAADIAEAGRHLNHIAAEVAMLEERWLAIHAELDAINAG